MRPPSLQKRTPMSPLYKWRGVKHLKPRLTRLQRKSKKTRCPGCRKVFHDITQLQYHLALEHRDYLAGETLLCCYCLGAFGIRNNLKTHMMSYHVHNSCDIRCPDCNWEFSDVYELMTHWNMEHEADVIETEFTPLRSPELLAEAKRQRDARITVDDHPWRCRHCDAQPFVYGLKVCWACVTNGMDCTTEEKETYDTMKSHSTEQEKVDKTPEPQNHESKEKTAGDQQSSAPKCSKEKHDCKHQDDRTIYEFFQKASEQDEVIQHARFEDQPDIFFVVLPNPLKRDSKRLPVTKLRHRASLMMKIRGFLSSRSCVSFTDVLASEHAAKVAEISYQRLSWSKAVRSSGIMSEKRQLHDLRRLKNPFLDEAGNPKEVDSVRLGQMHEIVENFESEPPKDTKKPRCMVCWAVLTQSNNYAAHMKAHFGSDPLQCGECDLSFTTPLAFARHSTMHKIQAQKQNSDQQMGSTNLKKLESKTTYINRSKKKVKPLEKRSVSRRPRGGETDDTNGATDGPNVTSSTSPTRSASSSTLSPSAPRTSRNSKKAKRSRKENTVKRKKDNTKQKKTQSTKKRKKDATAVSSVQKLKRSRGERSRENITQTSPPSRSSAWSLFQASLPPPPPPPEPPVPVIRETCHPTRSSPRSPPPPGLPLPDNDSITSASDPPSAGQHVRDAQIPCQTGLISTTEDQTVGVDTQGFARKSIFPQVHVRKKKKFEDWSEDDVSNWLTQLTFGRPYVDVFREKNVNGIVLTTLSDEMLEFVFKVKFGHVVKLRKAIERLLNGV